MEIDTVNDGRNTIFVNYQPALGAWLVYAPSVPLESFPVDGSLAMGDDVVRVAALYAKAYYLRGSWVLAAVRHCHWIYERHQPAFVVPS